MFILKVGGIGPTDSPEPIKPSSDAASKPSERKGSALPPSGEDSKVLGKLQPGQRGNTENVEFPEVAEKTAPPAPQNGLEKLFASIPEGIPFRKDGYLGKAKDPAAAIEKYVDSLSSDQEKS